ncbi:uncharacterized protein [Vicugna pacos]|uniref:Uncharacterized protein isoform X2 n=1 Tax=Vicugna pacos TaxID=30538 RepID=A0ABM5E519_VICPA
MSFSLYPVGRGWQACQEGGCPRWAVTERGLSQGMVFGWGPHPCCSRTSPVGASWTPGPQTPFFVELERLPWKPGTPRPRLSQAPAVSASVGRSPAAPPAGAQTRLSGLNSHVPTRTHTRTLCTRSPRTHTHSHVLTHICQHAILRLLRNPATELETTYVKEQTFVLPQDRALEWTPSELGNCWTSCHTAPHCGHSPDPAHSRPLSAGRMHSREPLTQTESRAPASAWGPWSQESFHDMKLYRVHQTVIRTGELGAVAGSKINAQQSAAFCTLVTIRERNKENSPTHSGTRKNKISRNKFNQRGERH